MIDSCFFLLFFFSLLSSFFSFSDLELYIGFLILFPVFISSFSSSQKELTHLEQAASGIMNFQALFPELLKDMIQVGCEVQLCETDEENSFKKVWGEKREQLMCLFTVWLAITCHCEQDFIFSFFVFLPTFFPRLACFVDVFPSSFYCLIRQLPSAWKTPVLSCGSCRIDWMTSTKPCTFSATIITVPITL